MRFFFNVFLQTKVTVNCETKSSLNKNCFSVRGCFFVRCLLIKYQLEYSFETGKELVRFLHAEAEGAISGVHLSRWLP